MCGEWQPIETAPKDGTFVLVYQPHDNQNLDHQDCVSLVKWDTWTTAVGEKVGEWELAECGGWAEDCCPFNDNPTHWMPLPKPPTATA